MWVSCNGCRVLRKGCSEDCNIRPCLQWIDSPKSQANATLFLAKFYGRVGLNNLINASPEHFRPELFRSLLHEVCGRIVNPIYGSVGLLWSGSWQLCQNAVEAVLKGEPITPISFDPTANMRIKPSTIRHESQDEANVGSVIKPKPNNESHESSSSHWFESDHQAREISDEVSLELKLGFEPTSRVDFVVPMKKRRII